MDIKKYIKNIYNGFYEIFIEGNDKKHLQKFIDEKQWEKENTIYYVISCEKLPFLGLFGYVEIILAMAKYALERDMVPVVDFKNYPNSYLESNEIGKINAWELFFQQFTKKTLDEIYENCKYIVGNHMDIDWSNLPNIRGVKRRDIGTYWKVMYQNYIKFSKEAEKYCQKEYDALLKGKEAETLGVLVRGTDIKLFKGHALQPSLEQVEEKIRKILKKDHRFKYLYLATEEKKSEDYLKEKLKDAYLLPYDEPCMHEFVLSGDKQKEYGVSTLNIAKGLMDENTHPPTVYFPLIVHEAIMIEPTESENKEVLDKFVDVMLKIAEDAKTNPQKLISAPHTTPVKRLDETLAARQPDLKFVQ